MTNLRRWLAVLALAPYIAVQIGNAAATTRSARVVFITFAVALGVAMVGVLRRKLWARWLAMGASLVGLSQIAVAVTLGFGDAGVIPFAAMAATVFAALAGPCMAAHFVEPLPAASVWRKLASSPRLQLLATSVVLAVAAVGTAWLFGAWLESRACFIAGTILAVGAALVAAEKTAGILVMLGGGLACVPVAEEALQHAMATPFCGFSMLGTLWGMMSAPALVAGTAASVAAFAVFAAPMLRFLRRGA